LNTPNYRVLFGELDPESAGRVTERLRAQDIPFQLSDGGRTILVPEERIDQLRIDFATNGLPNSGRMGFEIFDTTQFGATEFLEQVNFRRALEGEIARTIATISEVASARVHIAMAKDRLFGAQEEPAKASVVLKLKSGRAPAAATIQGIAALVAAAVEGLRPETVVIMDTNGRPLANPANDSGEPLSGAQVERQHQYEQLLAKEVVALLEPAVGPGGVRANIAAQWHLETRDQLEELWDPTPVVRSQSTTMEGSGGAGLSQGVAGARANLPGPVAPGANEPSPTTLAPPATSMANVTNPIRISETKNNEISKKTIKTSRQPGGLARLSVAVMVDDEHFVEKDQNGQEQRKTRPRNTEQMQKLTELVNAAVGFDASRGDQVTVQNVAFNEPIPDAEEAPSVLERYAPQVSFGVKVVVILLLGTAAFFLVGRPMMRRVVDAQPVVEGVMGAKQLPRTIEEIEGDIAAQLESAGAFGDRRLPVLSRRVSGLAQKDPEVAARLVRTWLMEDKK
jgi:flagellar M-ring protein FliF